MKRFIVRTLTLALVLGCISLSVFAAGRNCPMAGIRKGCICDRAQAVCVSMCRNNSGACRTQGINYTDGNNDGICDNKPAESCTRKATGQHHGGQHHGSRKGCHR